MALDNTEIEKIEECQGGIEKIDGWRKNGNESHRRKSLSKEKIHQKTRRDTRDEERSCNQKLTIVKTRIRAKNETNKGKTVKRDRKEETSFTEGRLRGGGIFLEVGKKRA